jgi:hypothetical protein
MKIKIDKKIILGDSFYSARPCPQKSGNIWGQMSDEFGDLSE